MIPGLPDADSDAVLDLLKQQPALEQVVLTSPVLERHHSGSDVDLCLVASSLQLEDLLLLGARLDDLLLPWRFDLQLQHRIDYPRLAGAHRAGWGGLAPFTGSNQTIGSSRSESLALPLLGDPPRENWRDGEFIRAKNNASASS